MAFLFGNHGKKINIVDAVYPIGSIYLSVNSTNPSNFLGGVGNHGDPVESL